MPQRDYAREVQGAIYLDGARGRRPRVPVAPERLEAAAHARMRPAAFAYVAGGAGAERTIRANREAFERRRIVPRVLRDVERRDTSLALFGRVLPAPLVLAPVGVLELAHADADLAVARAAAAAGLPVVFSSQASVPLETCTAVMGGAPRWFQLYWSRSDDLVESFVARAEACGCDAIVVTLDTTLLGWRPRDLDLAHLPFLRGSGIAQYTSDPAFRRLLEAGDGGRTGPAAGTSGAARLRGAFAAAHFLLSLARAFPGSTLRNVFSRSPRAAVALFIETYSRPSLTWDDLAFLRERTRLPIVLKGILHADDARRAVDAGVDGIWVSNHGGRQVDGAIASLDALPGIAEVVRGRLPVLLDGGVRGGADAFKALALGATAVALGRPYVYGLALGGAVGVAEVLRNVRAELDLTLALTGCRDLDDARAATLAEAPA